MNTDISIDLETLGQRFDAPIISIGAAAFNRETGKVGPTYYAEVKLKEAISYGRVDAGTLEWWFKQGDKARVVFGAGEHKVGMYEALRGLNDFVRAQKAGINVWGNGSSFDITLLERHYDVVGGANGFKEEWKYWCVRDMRTIVDAAQYDTKTHKRVGTHHNALDDAVFQAEVIAACLRKISQALAGKKALVPVAVDEDDEL